MRSERRASLQNLILHSSQQFIIFQQHWNTITKWSKIDFSEIVSHPCENKIVFESWLWRKKQVHWGFGGFCTPGDPSYFFSSSRRKRHSFGGGHLPISQLRCIRLVRYFSCVPINFFDQDIYWSISFLQPNMNQNYSSLIGCGSYNRGFFTQISIYDALICYV